MWMWFLSTYIQMKSEPVFYGRSNLSSSMKLEIVYLHTLVGLLMQRKHMHHQNNTQQWAKKWQKSTLSVVLYPIFLYIPLGARTITWPFCLPSTGKIQVQHPAGTRRTIKTTFSNRKRSQTIAQFILIAKGLQAIYLFRF